MNHREIYYSVRLGMGLDGTWLQPMCYAYSDVLSLYLMTDRSEGEEELKERE